MPVLQAAHAAIELKPAKANGLAELGVPVADGTSVKKGKLGEFEQPLDSGKPGRRYQNVKVALVKAVESGEPSAQLILSFEVFGDDNVPLGVNAGVLASLTAGEVVVVDLKLGSLFMPYACCWYENRFAARVPLDMFERADGLRLQALPDDVRLV